MADPPIPPTNPTPEQISAKQVEFNQAQADMVRYQQAFEQARGPYVEAKSALAGGIDRVGGIHKELVALLAGYKPPALPEPL